MQNFKWDSGLVIVGMVVAYAVGMAASSCAAVKPYARTVNDAAHILCEIAAAEQPPDKLGGMSVADWCALHRNLQPFLEAVLAAQQQGSSRVGFAYPAASASAGPAPSGK